MMGRVLLSIAGVLLVLLAPTLARGAPSPDASCDAAYALTSLDPGERRDLANACARQANHVRVQRRIAEMFGVTTGWRSWVGRAATATLPSWQTKLWRAAFDCNRAAVGDALSTSNPDEALFELLAKGTNNDPTSCRDERKTCIATLAQEFRDEGKTDKQAKKFATEYCTEHLLAAPIVSSEERLLSVVTRAMPTNTQMRVLVATTGAATEIRADPPQAIEIPTKEGRSLDRRLWVIRVPSDEAVALSVRDPTWQSPLVLPLGSVPDHGAVVDLSDVSVGCVRLDVETTPEQSVWVDGQPTTLKLLRVPLLHRGLDGSVHPTDVHVLERQGNGTHGVVFHRRLDADDFAEDVACVEVSLDLRKSNQVVLTGVTLAPSCRDAGVDAVSIERSATDSLDRALPAGRTRGEFREIATLAQETRALEAALVGTNRGVNGQRSRGREELSLKVQALTSRLWHQGARDLLSVGIGCAGKDGPFIVTGGRLHLDRLYAREFDPKKPQPSGLYDRNSISVQDAAGLERAAARVIRKLLRRPELSLHASRKRRLHRRIEVRVDVFDNESSSSTKIDDVLLEAYQLTTSEAERVCPMLSRGRFDPEASLLSAGKKIASGRRGDYLEGVCEPSFDASESQCEYRSDDPSKERHGTYYVWPREGRGAVLIKARLLETGFVTRRNGDKGWLARRQRRGRTDAFVTTTAPRPDVPPNGSYPRLHVYDNPTDSRVDVLDTAYACVDLEPETVVGWAEASAGLLIPVPRTAREARGVADDKLVRRENRLLRIRLGVDYTVRTRWPLSLNFGGAIGYASVTRSISTLPSLDDVAGTLDDSGTTIQWRRLSGLASANFGITSIGCRQDPCSRTRRGFYWQLQTGLELDAGGIDARATPDGAVTFRGGGQPRVIGDADLNIPISLTMGGRFSKRLWAGFVATLLFAGLDDLSAGSEFQRTAQIRYDSAVAWTIGLRLGGFR